MTTTTTHRPASPAQVSFVQSLLHAREVPADKAQWIRDELAAEKLTTQSASRVIDFLKAQPFPTDDRPEAAPGFYVRDGWAFKVQTNKAGTHTYALVWEGTSWDYRPGAARNLSGLVPMTAEQAAALGLASGRCINCCAVLGGETLGAKVAALIGYGETCAKHNGWAFPKGAKAQRDFIASHTEREEV